MVYPKAMACCCFHGYEDSIATKESEIGHGKMEVHEVVHLCLSFAARQKQEPLFRRGAERTGQKAGQN